MVTQVNSPDATYEKIYFAGIAGSSSGWKRGLPRLIESYDSSGVLQRQSATIWDQDNLGVSYPLNPRIKETNVYDPTGNHRRTRIEYTSLTLPSGSVCYLPMDVYDYQADANNVYRRTHTDYVTDSAYLSLSQWLVGLPSGVTLYDAGNVAQSIKLYRYDWASHLEAMPGNVNPAQHDPGYNTSFTVRGNLVSVQRISTDPNDPPNTNTELKWGYNVSGSVTFTRDPDWHQNFFSYADLFSDSINHNSFAYPTTVTDADSFSSSVRYNYDFGGTTWKQTPLPNTTDNTPGPQQTLTYDDLGRLQRVTQLTNGAYTRYEYPASGTSYARKLCMSE